jgi:hypothetical protein
MFILDSFYKEMIKLILLPDPFCNDLSTSSHVSFLHNATITVCLGGLNRS